MLKAKELMSKDVKELEALLKQARSEVFNLQVQVIKRKLKNLRVVRAKKVEIARLLTVLEVKKDNQ